MTSRSLFKFVVGLSLPLVISAVTVRTAVFLGNITSTNTEDIRDLGFAGTIGKVSINTYGDTLICGDGSAHDRYYQTPPCNLLAANGAAYSTANPVNITDFNLDGTNAQMFCNYNSEEVPHGDYGMGLTNVIAIPGSTTTGVLYFLKNHRPGGKDNIVGAGVAIVDVSGKYPTCTRTSDHWWDSHKEPNYGDHTQVLGQDGNIYVFGGANTTLFYDGLYLARVPHANQTVLSMYEYWNGTKFTKERIYNPSNTQAVLGNGTTQGSVSWNPHLNQYLILYTVAKAFQGNKIVGRTASKPEGPWSDEFLLYQSPNFAFVYSPVAQTRYDPTGKSLVISYTGYPNILQAVNVTFS